MQLRNAQGEVHNLKRRMKDTEAAAANKSKGQKAQIATLHITLKQRKIQHDKDRRILENNRDRDLRHLNTKLQAASRDYDLLMEYEDKVRRGCQDAQLQLEYLKCTTTEPVSNVFVRDENMRLPAESFVVLLVDGDAYGVSEDTRRPPVLYGRATSVDCIASDHINAC